MEPSILFVLGFACGFLGSMPVAGPIAILVFSLVLERRNRQALGVAVGAALAEGIYAGLAFFGFSALLAEYEIVGPISRAVAAIILTVIGLALVRRRPSEETPSAKLPRGAAPLLGFTICAVNPTLLVTWSATVTTLFSTELVTFTPAASPLFGFAVAVGIGAWFSLVALAGGTLAARIRSGTVDLLLRLMGFLALLLAAGFAVWAAASFVG